MRTKQQLTLYEKIVEIANTTPDSIAVTTNKFFYTFANLLQTSTQIKNILLEQRLKPNSHRRILVYLPKGFLQISTIIGVSMADYTFIPINIKTNMSRIENIYRQSEASFILTSKSYYKTLPHDLLSNVLWLEDLLIENNIKANNLQHKTPLAYIMFTSGSTGIPKGVMISHENAHNTIQAINNKFSINQKDSILALSSIDFDLSIYDIFGLLATGGTLVIPDTDKILSPEHWLELIINHQITIWNSVPAFIDMLIKHLEYQSTVDINVLTSLRLVLLSGDWIPLELPGKIQRYFPNARIISLGGATEASIWSISYEIQSINQQWTSIPYGKALDGQQFYILDDSLNQIRDARIGELYIGGKGVAQGYVNDIEKTQHAFVQHRQLGRLYKTGDLGKWGEDNNIIFLGRKDTQVKINGFRIELSGIEKIIKQDKHIKKAIVKKMVRSKNLVQLIAYLMLNKQQKISPYFLESQKQLTREHEDRWKNIYNNYFSSSYTNTLKTEFVGWLNSYNHQPIPYCEMQAWLIETLVRIRALLPRRVLEIGSGTGVLLFELAKECDYYYATDNASSSITYIQQKLQSTSFTHYVHTQETSAINIKAVKKNNFDTVILNSITQYFPSADYFKTVLDDSITKITPSGSVFIGDIYNLQYIDDFYFSVANYSQPELTRTLYTTQQNYFIREENYLFIHPEFFVQYALQHQRVTHCHIQLKKSKHFNEMSRFRYDVTLFINKTERSFQPLKSNIHVIKQLNDIHHICSQHRLDTFLFSGLKNKQITSIYKEEVKNAINPFAIETLATQYGYQFDIAPSLSNPSTFTIAFYKKQNPLVISTNQKELVSPVKINYYFNDPIKTLYLTRFRKDLRKQLEKQLREYEIPQHIIFIKRLPLSNNGKIDTKQFTYFEQSDYQIFEHYSKTEQEIYFLWSELLLTSFINLDNNFFALGGNSLLALDMLAIIEDKFAIHVPLNEFLKLPTIAGLVQCINNARD